MYIYLTVNDMDYLQIDTEGYDAEIIDGLPFIEFTVKMIKYESVNLKTDAKEKTKSLLAKNGFLVFEFKEDTVAIQKGLKLIFK